MKWEGGIKTEEDSFDDVKKAIENYEITEKIPLGILMAEPVRK